MGLQDNAGQTDRNFIQDEYAKDSSKGKESSDSFSIYKLKGGLTQARVLPPYGNSKSWFKEIKIHYLPGVRRPVVCLSVFGLPCPLCDEGRRLFHTKDEANVEKSKRFRPRTQFLMNAIILSDPENKGVEMGVQVLQTGVKVKEALVYLDYDFAGGWGDMTSLKNGFDVRIERRGDRMENTEYLTNGVPMRTDIEAVLSAQGVDCNSLTLFNLDEVFEAPDEKVMASMITGDYVPGFPTSAAPVEVPTVTAPQAQAPAAAGPPAGGPARGPGPTPPPPTDAVGVVVEPQTNAPEVPAPFPTPVSQPITNK